MGDGGLSMLVNPFSLLIGRHWISVCVIRMKKWGIHMAKVLSPRLQKLVNDVVTNGEDSLSQFWNEVEKEGTPLIEAVPATDAECYVTFLYRSSSGVDNVVVFLGPTSGLDGQMSLLENTDVWYKTYRLKSDARFMYQLSVNDSLVPLMEIMRKVLDGNPEEIAKRMQTFQRDPLNKFPYQMSTVLLSTIHLPESPAQPFIQPRTAIPAGTVHHYRAASAELNNERDYWVYLPPAYSENAGPYPVAIFLDGQIYNSDIPTPFILDNLLAEGRIPPLVAVFISSIDEQVRMEELSGSSKFLQFVTDEVLGLVRERYRVTADPDRTIVAGFSLGGFSAIYFGLTRPDVYGNILSQSGSFWLSQPDTEQRPEGMSRLFEKAERLPLRIFMEAGLMESEVIFPGTNTSLLDANRRLREVLQRKGYPLHYSEFNGDHSVLCWRGSVSDGLQFLTDGWE